MIFQTKCLIQPIAAYSSTKLSHSDNLGISRWTMFQYRLSIKKARYSISRLKVCGENLYAVVAKYPDFKDYIEKYRMPNT